MDFAYDDTNVFARILRGELPATVVAENEHALAFRNISPHAPVHVLVVPRGPFVSLDHFARDASAAEQAGFLQLVAEVARVEGLDSGFRAIANARAHGGQEVPHFHLHVIGGRPLGPLLATD